MSNFDLTTILDQQQLTKKKLDKILKELVFHNSRNALNGFPIEFMEQYSTVDKDTLVLVLQCNKSVSADVSSYLSGTSDERRRSSMNPAADKIRNKKDANVEEDSANASAMKESDNIQDGNADEPKNKADDIDNQQQKSEEINNSGEKKEDSNDQLNVEESNVATNQQGNELQNAEINSTETSNRNIIIAEEDNNSQDSSKNQEEVNESSLKDVDLTSDKENLKEEVAKQEDDITNQVDSEASNYNETLQENENVSGISDMQHSDGPTTNEGQQEIEAISENDNVDERKTEQETNESVEVSAEIENSTEQEETETSKPKQLMTKIAEEAAGIVEKRGPLELEDDQDGKSKKKIEEESNIDEVDVDNKEEIPATNEKTGKKKKLVLKKMKKSTKDKKEKSAIDGEATAVTEVASVEVQEEKEHNTSGKNTKSSVAEPFATSSEQTEANEGDGGVQEDDGIQSDKEVIDQIEIHNSTVDGTEEDDSEKIKSAINGEVEYEKLREGDNEESQNYNLREYQESEYEEKTFDDIRTVDHTSGRVSRANVANDEYAEEVTELTDAEREYINKAKTFHGRQCRRRRIRRIREEEGEYLDTNEVITRIRQKTEALLERQHKLMKRVKYL